MATKRYNRKDPKVEKWLKKKEKKHRYWQIKTFLKNLRIPFKELDKDSDNYNIAAPLFGLKFRFNTNMVAEDIGWEVIYIDPKELEKKSDYFYEDALWYLISRGIFAYLRESTNNNEGIAKTLLIQQQWGYRILEKRIELYGNDPKWKFQKMRMEEFRKKNIIQVLSWYPDFFDFLI